MNGILFLIALLFLLSPQLALGQQTKSYRVGVIHPGGSQYETLDGLREGLKELGLNEGKQLTLDIRDVKGDASAAGQRSHRIGEGKRRLDLRAHDAGDCQGEGERPAKFRLYFASAATRSPAGSWTASPGPVAG